MENSNISWTQHSFNCWHGCKKVSEACKFCYAEKMDARFYKELPHWGEGSSRKMMSVSYWRQPILWNKRAKENGVNEKVFCASMADVFENHSDVVEAREKLWNLIDKTPNLTWLILTKRPENILEMLPDRWKPLCENSKYNVPKNIWFGSSIENQKRYDERFPEMHLVKTSTGNITFYSVEPMLGKTSLSLSDRVDWVICGGESGKATATDRIRSIKFKYAISLANQCNEMGKAFFMKQLGTVKAKLLKLKDTKGGDMEEWPSELDGIKRREFPHEY